MMNVTNNPDVRNWLVGAATSMKDVTEVLTNAPIVDNARVLDQKTYRHVLVGIQDAAEGVSTAISQTLKNGDARVAASFFTTSKHLSELTGRLWALPTTGTANGKQFTLSNHDAAVIELQSDILSDQVKQYLLRG